MSIRVTNSVQIREASLCMYLTGMKVAAKFGTGDDEMWYRAEVISCYLDGNPAYVEVFYLDYGNSDNVSMRG